MEGDDSELHIPRDYEKIVDYITENKQRILGDRKVMKRIIDEMDQMLDEAADMADLRQDSSVLLTAVRLQQDALIKEYHRDLTTERLVEMANHGELDEFMADTSSKKLGVQFADQLVLEYKPKEKRKQRERSKYTKATGEPRVPKNPVPEDHPEAIAAVGRIKQVVERNGTIEYFTLIMDPNSYSQTVQNAFNLSLAARLKAVSLVQKSGILFVTKYSPGDKNAGQSILEITPEQHRTLVRTMNIAKGLLNS